MSGQQAGHQRSASDDLILGTSTTLSSLQADIAKMHIKTPTANSTGDNSTGGPYTRDTIPVDNLTEPADVPVVFATPVVQARGDMNTTAKDVTPEPTAAVNEENDTINTGDDDCTATHPPPAIPPATTPGGPPVPPGGSPRLSLAALQDPNTFNLGDATPPSKRRITKSSFNKTGGLTEPEPSDPLGQLDALWTVKPKS